MTVAVCIETPTKFARRTIANATPVPIGTLMKLNDANTVVVSAANSDPFGGIAWEEKTASDGLTEITCAMNGKWGITSTAAAITAGAIVSIGGADSIEAAVESDFPVGTNVGKILNTLGGGGGVGIVMVGDLI